MIDKRITSEIVKLRKDIDSQVSDIRSEIESDMDALSDRVEEIASNFVRSQAPTAPASTNEDIKLNIVIRKLPETVNENVESKVNALIKDGLKLRDIDVATAERKKTHNENVPGVVKARLSNRKEMKRILENIASLNNDRRYRDVFIHNDQSR